MFGFSTRNYSLLFASSHVCQRIDTKCNQQARRVPVGATTFGLEIVYVDHIVAMASVIRVAVTEIPAGIHLPTDKLIKLSKKANLH